MNRARSIQRAALMGSSIMAAGVMAAASSASADSCHGSAVVLQISSGTDSYCSLDVTEALIVEEDATISTTTLHMGVFGVDTDRAEVTVRGPGASLTLTDQINFRNASERLISVENGGTLNINSYSQYLDHDVAHNAIVHVQGAGSHLNFANGAMYFGVWGGDGDMLVADGGRVSMAGTSYMGVDARSTSEITVTGKGSVWDLEHMLEIARDGSAVLNVLNGGTVNSSSLLVARSRSGEGKILVQGNNSVVTSTQAYIGGVGRGELTLRNGGRFEVTHDVTIGNNQPNSGSAIINIGGAAGEDSVRAGQLVAERIFVGRGAVVNFNHTGDFETSASWHSANNAGILNQMAGSTILSGSGALFSGVTNVTGGRLSFTNSLGGTINIIGGNVRGQGFTGQLNVLASGTYVAMAGSVLDAQTGILFAAGSSLEVEVDPATGEFGVLNTAGQLTIEGGLVRHFRKAGKYQPKRSYTIMTSAAPIIGEFDGVETNFAFLDASLVYDTNTVTLVLQRNDIDFSGIGITRNQRAAGAAVSALGFDALLFDAVIDLSEDEARSAFGQLAGESYGTVRTAMLDDSVAIRQAIAPVVREEERAKGTTSVWFSPIAAKTTFDASREFAGMDVKSEGGLMGADYALTDNWQVGFVGGFDKAELEASGFESDRDSYHLGLYAKGSRGKLGVRGGYVVSQHELDGTRVIEFPDFKTTQYGDYDAQTRQAFVEANWAMSVGAFAVSPFVSAAHVTVQTDAFEERGLNGALSIDEAEQEVILASVGVAAQRGFTVAGRKGIVAGRVAYENASGDTAAVQHQSFDGGDRFTVEGMGYDKNAVATEIGVSLPLGRAGAVSVDWQGVFGDQRTRNQFSATYRLTF